MLTVIVVLTLSGYRSLGLAKVLDKNVRMFLAFIISSLLVTVLLTVAYHYTGWFLLPFFTMFTLPVAIILTVALVVYVLKAVA